ncbi:MAG: twin-arginine translocase TatA/TatE family subunit [Vulcanimicrobiaceae bacterium]
MISPVDALVIGAFALIVFGPEQLPKVARRAGQVLRDVQMTSQSFIREMERAADEVGPPADSSASPAAAPEWTAPGAAPAPSEEPDPRLRLDI